MYIGMPPAHRAAGSVFSPATQGKTVVLCLSKGEGTSFSPMRRYTRINDASAPHFPRHRYLNRPLRPFPRPHAACNGGWGYWDGYGDGSSLRSTAARSRTHHA